MDQIWLHLLFLSGLLSLTLCKPQEYILYKQLKTWEDAQNYCRTHHYDLATIQTDEDWTSLKEAAGEQQFYGFAWIGLFNDINSWRWSYNEESLVFESWGLAQPDNYGMGQECVTITFDGNWLDFYCTDLRYFVCYDGSTNATEKMVLSKTQNTWTDAQKYCRRHYTDLASIRSQEDNDQIIKLIYSLGVPVWIGLYRDTWKWSDQTNVTSSTKLTTQTFTKWNENCAGADNYYRVFDDRYCTNMHYFYCNTVKRKRQVIRVQVKAAENVDEAKLKVLVLNKVDFIILI
uniref:C-type lectin domain-containing protein n=1 Tax=Cyprinus carpio TaxID=7962 RepID=A0A8C2AXP9_CYPCA